MTGQPSADGAVRGGVACPERPADFVDSRGAEAMAEAASRDVPRPTSTPDWGCHRQNDKECGAVEIFADAAQTGDAGRHSGLRLGNLDRAGIFLELFANRTDQRWAQARRHSGCVGGEGGGAGVGG